MMFAKLLPKFDMRKIYAFEPSSYNCNRLRKNISQSDFRDIVLPQQIALGEID